MSKKDKSKGEKSKGQQSKQSQEVAVSSKGGASPAAFDRQIEDLFEDFFNRRWPKFGDLMNMRMPSLELPKGGSLETKLPSMDVIDREKEVLVRAELPGIDKQDIDVSVSGNSVTVQGSSRTEKASETEKEHYHHREIVSHFVSRTMPLPCEVEGDNAVAKMSNGVLEVTIPKAESAKRKRVEIQS